MRKLFIFLPVVMMACLIFFNLALAAEDDKLKYVPLENLSVTDTRNVQGPTSPITASQYISNFFTAFMAVIVAMAILMIAIGGVKLMTAGDNPSMKTEGRADIMGAVYGLILALLTYMILDLINPRLLPGDGLFDFELKVTSTTVEYNHFSLNQNNIIKHG